MSDVPTKVCDYCEAVGVMPTFMDGETICYSCLKDRPDSIKEAYAEMLRLRQELAECGMSEHLHNVRRTMERGLKMAQAQMEDVAEGEIRPGELDILIGRHADTYQHALDELERYGIKPPGGEEMSKVKEAHEQIETLWANLVDHLHADVLHRFVDEQQEEITRLHQELAECKALYNELIYEVASKFPDESRHETARRYIRQMENKPCERPCETASPTED